MIRKITGIYASSTRSSTPLDLAKKYFCWKKMKGLESTPFISTAFNKSEELLSDTNQGDLTGNQDNSGKNLNFFLKDLPKATITENIENPISMPGPTK